MEYKVAIIGLGYVGLPLAVAASEKHHVIGFDINTARIEDLISKYDRSRVIDSEALDKSRTLLFSNYL